MDEMNIHIDLLTPYPNHPFALYEGKRMDDMMESIKELGIISPIIVRPVDGGKYEILSGHNRVEAAKRAGLAEIPAVAKVGLADGEAALIVTESNLVQRSFADLRYSERAIVLKNHLEALKKLGSQGMRNDLLAISGAGLGAQIAHKSKSRDMVADQYALSKDTVVRYVRLAKLPKQLLDKVDNGKLKFIAAVTLSWLSDSELEGLSRLLENDEVSVSLKHAKRLRTESEKADGKLSEEVMAAILNEAAMKRKLTNISLPEGISERLAGYNVSSDRIIGEIISIYLDMVDRGEAKNIFDREADSGE